MQNKNVSSLQAHFDFALLLFLQGLVLCFIPDRVLSQTDQKELSVSVIAPPQGFEDHLKRALDEFGNYRLSSTWALPSEADFVVFFYDALGDDLSHLPVALFRQFEGLARLGPAPMYFSVNISGPFSNVAFISWAELDRALFGSSGNDRSSELASCVAAYKVVQQILSDPHSNSENLRLCSEIINVDR